MIGRTVPEWRGATPDTPIPARVKLRIFEAQGRRCAECARDLRGKDVPQYDHIRALVNVGEKRGRFVDE